MIHSPQFWILVARKHRDLAIFIWTKKIRTKFPFHAQETSYKSVKQPHTLEKNPAQHAYMYLCSMASLLQHSDSKPTAKNFWGSVLGPTLANIGREPTFLKSHQIPKFPNVEIHWTRANTQNEDIGLGPTQIPRVHSRLKIRFGIKIIAYITFER